MSMFGRSTKPHKYNDGRKILKQIGIRPANWLARGVYTHLEAHGYRWTGARWVSKTEELVEHARAMSDPFNI